MKKNRFILIVVLVLGALAVYLLLSRSKNTLKKEMRDFAVEDTASITKIFMADKANHQVTLARTDSGYWMVNHQFQVRPQGISMLLKTVSKVTVMEPVPKASRNTVIKRLAASAVKVEVYQKKYRINLFGKIRLFPHEKRTKVYYVGSATQDNMGTYMLLEGSDIPCITFIPGFKGYLSVRYSPRMEDWRTHAIFNTPITQIKSVKIDFVEVPGFSYEVSKATERTFELKSIYTGKVIPDYDTLKMLEFLASFASVNFEVVVTGFSKSTVDSIIHSRPFHVITLTETSGKSQVVKTFHRKNPGDSMDESGNYVPWDRDRMYALINEGKDLVLVQFFVFDNITLPIGAFLKPNAPASP